MKFAQNLIGKLKNSWLLFAFGIVALILWNTNTLFRNLSQEERTKMELWAMAQEEYIQNQDLNNLTFEILQRSGQNPMIQVDAEGNILEIRNIDWSDKKEDSTELYRILEKIKQENLPILIQYRDSTGNLVIDQKLYYGNSTTLKKLQYYPLALLLIIILFGAVLYFVFKTAKIAEQNRLWAAMAKETAHQIGTPLTSMMGWLTLLKEKHPESSSLNEIEKDIERLNLITDRFSKVGSIPELHPNDIIQAIKNTVNYLQKRSSEQIQFKLDLPKEKIILPFNPQLISWTLENLIKNGIDAMKGKGVLHITLNEFAAFIEILVQDTGSGMKKETASKIFKPGFTTKARGWGLGLSLAKRIVEDFHSGKIAVQKTTLGQGTTFQLILNKEVKK
ncbi:ATP-binding protein [Flavobacteriaceae bacterium]|nr:ATP-binding protein [Flavobacteriaceae bacterium]MDA9572048.1 ATP-binding protein [Flavobacteriaceae bacterium]MDB3862255.1 ATP-binding protein [Flavobacteriaceae bacterium]